MRLSFASRFRKYIILFAVTIGLCVFSDCSKKSDDGIRTSTAPRAAAADKPATQPGGDPTSKSPAGPQMPPHGMSGKMPPGMMGMMGPPPKAIYGAIVLRAPVAWSFKVSSKKSAEQIDKHIKEIDTFLKSVSFPEGERAAPTYVVPAGWKKGPPRMMRHATFLIGEGDSPLELTVVPISFVDREEKPYLLENVNRWRKQVRQSPITLDKLGENTSKLKMQNVEATTFRAAVPRQPE